MSKYVQPRNRKPGEPLIPFLLSELKPKGPLVTPFNVVTIPIIIAGLVFVAMRFIFGLESMTNLDQEFPWGIWIGFDVVCGVALAGGAYTVTAMVYVFRLDKYHSIVRATVLNGLLAYCFYAGALLLDLGRYWNIVNPVLGESVESFLKFDFGTGWGSTWGYNSVLFLVAWHFMLYMATEALEYSPAVAQWLGYDRIKKVLKGFTIGAVIFGVCLSVLHQSGLGALFLLAKGKIHPLWYNEFIPLLFLVSSVFSGMCVVILEGTISHKIFHHLIPRGHEKQHNAIMFGLSKIAVGAMFVYLGMQGAVLWHNDHNVHLIATGWGAWWALEIFGFVLLPMILFTWAIKNRSLVGIRTAAIMTLLGIMLNRLNISVIAYKWYIPFGGGHYVPHIGEIVVTLMVISAELWIFRWIILRMPVLDDGEHGHEEPAAPAVAPATEPAAVEAK